jgi:histidyl-tRNA synthetase
MRDILPPEMARFRRIEDAFRAVCLGWGYREVRTPTIEHLYLFTAAGTLSPQMLDGVYSFLDWDGWSGERVVLRPDSTIPATRLYVENLAGETAAKLFYVQNVFRFQGGDDTREDWQCGVELIGATPRLGDVELIVMAIEVLERLGVKTGLKLSDPGILRAILDQAGLSHADRIAVYDRILSGDSSALAELQQNLAGAPPLSETLSMEGAGGAFVNNLSSLLATAVPGVEGPLDELTAVCEMLDAIGIETAVAPLLVRDFEYYTGPAFQLFAGEARVGGGGRYDALVSQIGGKSTPASGFALDIEPLLPLVGEGRAGEASISIHCKSGGRSSDALAIAVALRRKDFAVEVDGPSENARHVTVSKDGFVVKVDGGKPQRAASIDEAVRTVTGG